MKFIIIYYFYFIILLFIPIILVILPADYFDYGNSICLSVLLFDVKCYGCGMTKAIQHLIHLDFKAAYTLNKISFIVLPLLVFILLNEYRRIFRKIKKLKKS